MQLALSDERLRELNEVLSRAFILERNPKPARVFRAGMTLGLMGELYRPERFDWVSLTDAKDWWMLDLAFPSGADFIVTRDKRVLSAAKKLGFDAITPPRLLATLR